jgi:glycosyltransferase involved in cell wall biosynthesis
MESQRGLVLFGREAQKDSVHVTLLANYLPDELESMERYAGLLARLLAQEGWSVEVLRPEPFFGRLKRSGQGVGKWLGYIDKFILFPFALRRHVRSRKQAGKGAFLVHICDHGNAMYTRWLSDAPHVVTCHDVLAIQSGLGLIPEHKTGWTGRVLQRWILSGLRRAAQVVCVSEQTRKELLSLAPELEERSTIVENPLPHPYYPMPPEEAVERLAKLGVGGRPGPDRGRFLFHVGGNQWYKNREGVIRIFGQLRARYPHLTGNPPLHLVMAGKLPTETQRRLVEEEKLAENVVFPGAVSDEELCALYSLAEALIFPSLREGFGWPLIEAQACGCPVVTSDRAPMNQVAGPAALLASLERPSDFVDQLARLLSEDPALRKRRKAEARDHAGRYNPENFVKQLLGVYDTMLKKK